MNCGFPFLQNNPNCEFSPLELGHLSLKKFNILLVHIDVGCLLNYNSLDKPSLLPVQFLSLIVSYYWNQKRCRSLGCLSLPNPVSRDSDWIFKGALFRWLAIWEMGVHTLTDHLVFSFQAKVFVVGNKQGVVRGFEIQGGVNWIKKKNQQQLQHSRPGQWS